MNYLDIWGGCDDLYEVVAHVPGEDDVCQQPGVVTGAQAHLWCPPLLPTRFQLQ